MGGKRPEIDRGNSRRPGASSFHLRKGHGPAGPSRTISVNMVKSKIRDLTRLLDHAQHLPPGVRIEKERALVGYKQDLEAAKAEKYRQRMIKKYHMVRFFGQ